MDSTVKSIPFNDSSSPISIEVIAKATAKTALVAIKEIMSKGLTVVSLQDDPNDPKKVILAPVPDAEGDQEKRTEDYIDYLEAFPDFVLGAMLPKELRQGRMENEYTACRECNGEIRAKCPIFLRAHLLRGKLIRP